MHTRKTDTSPVWPTFLFRSEDANKLKRKSAEFEVFMTVTMKNVVFWDVVPCGLVRTDVSEEYVEVTSSSETSVIARPTRRHVPRNVFL
jgi:hypothetical protein